MIYRPILAALLAGSFASAAIAQYDAARAMRNYQAVSKGQKQLSDLSVQERREISALDRALDEHGFKRKTPDEQCREGQPTETELDRRALDLRCPPPQ